MHYPWASYIPRKVIGFWWRVGHLRLFCLLSKLVEFGKTNDGNNLNKESNLASLLEVKKAALRMMTKCHPFGSKYKRRGGQG